MTSTRPFMTFQAQQASQPHITPKTAPRPGSPSTQPSLQSRFPGLYARTATQLPLSQVVPNTQSAFETLNQVRTHTPASDYDLANLDDNLKRGGSLLIATLATLGMKQRIFGVGEFLGFASWFGAMSVTPLIINTLVRLKTGVNLGQMYESTYGQRLKVFKDPNYLPLHILSDAEINQVADKLNIPKNIPNRRQKTEEKMRQIAVQANTWWMLVAGPATPVISGLVCDLLQKPATQGINRLKLLWHAQKAAGNLQHNDKLARQTQAYLEQLLGDVPESSLVSWWKDFSRGMAHKTGLAKALSLKDLVDEGAETGIQKITQYLAGLNAGDPVMDTTAQYLSHKQAGLDRLQEQALKFLSQFESHLAPNDLKRQQRFIETQITNAASTITHYQDLLKALKGGAAESEILQLLEKQVLPEVQRLVSTGYADEAKRLVGNPSVFEQVRHALSIRQYGRAFRLMGASPGAHLKTALKDTLLHKLWQRRMILGLGGGLLLATVLFTQFVVGRDFKQGHHGGSRA